MPRQHNDKQQMTKTHNDKSQITKQTQVTTKLNDKKSQKICNDKKFK